MKLIIAAALALPITAAAGAQSPPSPQKSESRPAQAPFGTDRAEMPNLLANGRSDCPSIAKQVADATKGSREREAEARTLDREPPAHLLLAVDRHVDGCRQVTFLRRNIAPPSGPANLALEAERR